MGYLTVIGTFNYLSYEAMNIHEKCLRRPSTRSSRQRARQPGSNALKVVIVLTLRAFECVHGLGVNAKHETQCKIQGLELSTCGDERVHGRRRARRGGQRAVWTRHEFSLFTIDLLHLYSPVLSELT